MINTDVEMDTGSYAEWQITYLLDWYHIELVRGGGDAADLPKRRSKMIDETVQKIYAELRRAAEATGLHTDWFADFARTKLRRELHSILNVMHNSYLKGEAEGIAQ